MSNLLRGSRRSYQIDLQKKEHKRKLVLAALNERQKEQAGERLLADIIAAVPRTTDRHIDEVIKKVRKENVADAEKLEEALQRCRELAFNLNGSKPNVLWTDPARLAWSETIEAITVQTSRWKACPLVLIHPYTGTVEVVTSLCGKHQAMSEYTRMKLFAEDLKKGLEDILYDIHPIKDNETGHSIPFEETKEILLDLSDHVGPLEYPLEDEGRLSEDDDASDNNSDYEKVIERVSGDWTTDKIDSFDRPPALKSRLISSPKSTKPTTKTPESPVLPSLTTTPPPAVMNQSQSSLSSFDSPLAGVEPTPPKLPPPKSTVSVPQSDPPKPAPVKNTDNRRSLPQHVSRSLFSGDRQVTIKNDPNWMTTIQPLTDSESPPTSPSKHASDFLAISDAYPDGYTIVPVKARNKKSDARKVRDQKKRPVSSPNLRANKTSRMDRTEMAIERIQLNQANQNEILQKLASQLGQVSVALAMQNSKPDHN